MIHKHQLSRNFQSTQTESTNWKEKNRISKKLFDEYDDLDHEVLELKLIRRLLGWNPK